MMRALFRKQMMEVFSWLYQDKKSGKIRTSGGIMGYVLLYLLIFGALGVMFGAVAVLLCEPFLAAGMGWLYWCLMGMIAIFLGVFGSVFNTYSSLYQAKDNDLLLSMPIPVSHILLVRLSGVYAMGLMYELTVMIPTVIIWFIFAPFSLLGTLQTLLIPVVLSFFILVLSAVLGWVVAAVASRIRSKNIIVVCLSLVFIAAYYYIYGRAYAILQTILQNAAAVGEKLKNIVYPLYHMGLAAQGNLLSMLIFTAINALLTALTYIVLSRSFLRLATANRGGVKNTYKEQKAKAGSVGRALLRKEFKRFTGSANYMLNCGLGVILMPAAAIMLLWKADSIRPVLQILPTELLPLMAIGGICLIVAMNDMTAPSISLEGKNLWILQSSPISAKQILMAKLQMHWILTGIPAIPLIAAAQWLLQPDLAAALLIPMAVCLFILWMAAMGLALNLKMPNLHWSNEIIPIKQSAPVMITLLGGWVSILLLAGLYALLYQWISALGYMLCLCVLLAAGCVLLMRWLITRGARIFETLQ